MVSYKECRQFFDWMSFKCKGIIQYHSPSTTCVLAPVKNILTAAVLILSIGTIWDAVAAQ